LDTFTVLIVGCGKLAAELLQGIDGPWIAGVAHWDERGSLAGGPCMVAHAGSGRELDAVTGFCAENGATLLQLSTADTPLPATATFPIVICPNVNMPMLSFMAMVKHASKYFRGLDIRIAESHQASKSTRPGTAVHLATSLGVSECEIRSERDPRVQNEVLGIPSSFLDRHAYHEIVIRDPEVEIRMETRVLGKSAYAAGLAKVIEVVARTRPAPGCHDIVDLVMLDAENHL
jgi:dihydrodipicolinate reductase